MKRITLLGAGNLATQLALRLHDLNYKIVQIYSRTIESAELLAKKVDASYTIDISNVNSDSDFYIFSIKDSELQNTISKLTFNKGIWIHTSGSLSIDIFNTSKTERFGVIYPLQTFSKSVVIDWRNIPLFIEGSNEGIFNDISSLSKHISESVYSLSSDKRIYVHASGVFACNFTNHMYQLADEMAQKTGLSMEVLLPIIDETARKAHYLHPKEAQTGPAVRFDSDIMEMHLNIIESLELKELYKMLSASIRASHKK